MNNELRNYKCNLPWNLSMYDKLPYHINPEICTKENIALVSGNIVKLGYNYNSTKRIIDPNLVDENIIEGNAIIRDIEDTENNTIEIDNNNEEVINDIENITENVDETDNNVDDIMDENIETSNNANDLTDDNIETTDNIDKLENN